MAYEIPRRIKMGTRIMGVDQSFNFFAIIITKEQIIVKAVAAKVLVPTKIRISKIQRKEVGIGNVLLPHIPTPLPV